MARLFGRKKVIRNWIINDKNPEKLVRNFGFYTRFNANWNVKLSYGGGHFKVTDKQGSILYILHPSRITHYKKGIMGRANRLFDDYMIQIDQIQGGDVIIDCGANIGEIGVGLKLRNKKVRYIAFEPGPREHKVCSMNNIDFECENKALWHEEGELEFFEKSSTADSSLIEFSDYERITEVKAVKLDEYCKENNISKIKYLKVEAEGAEPEVLRGAIEILGNTKFVAVDCGFERGYDKSTTLTEVCNILIPMGFIFKEIRRDRFTALFARD